LSTENKEIPEKLEKEALSAKIYSYAYRKGYREIPNPHF
jgi:hypothetical protein